MKRRRGQGMVEYGLIIGLISIMVIGALTLSSMSCTGEPDRKEVLLERIAVAEEEQAHHLKEIARWCWTPDDDEEGRKRLER